MEVITYSDSDSFICHKNTSIHQNINAFTVKWSERFRNLKRLYARIQIQMFYIETQVITTAIKWENFDRNTHRCILVCIYAQLQHTTDIHEPRKKDQLLF